MGRKVPVKVRVWVTEQSSISRNSWKITLLTGTLLTGAVGLVFAGSWLGVRLIVSPGSLTWLSQILPHWGDFSAPQPQTLAEIGAEVQQVGQAIGAPLYFSSYPGMTQQRAGFNDVLLPILQAGPQCTRQPKGGRCGAILELRVYRSIRQPFRQSLLGQSVVQGPGTVYELIDRIGVTGPEELSAIARLSHKAITQGSTRTLPLTDMHFIEGQAPAGIWLQLSGEWKRGSRVLYGQVVQYDPEHRRLYAMQAWSSPAGQWPRWQQVTGDATAELVVDQSIGLEPQFQVYQLRRPRISAQPPTLEAISLTEAALADRTYANGLLLARHGLWSSALQILKAVKQRGKWSSAAQSQLDVVALHAKITQTQADRDWASPTQQILAQVMDGRWAKSLGLLKAAHQSGYDIENLLKQNADRLWQRVEAALRVNPHQADLQAWGTLVLAVQQNRTEAIAWLRRQPNPADHRSSEQTLALLQPKPDLNAIPDAVLPPVAVPTVPAAAPAVAGGLIGTVNPITTVQASDWLAVASLTLPAQQTWYRIEVVGFHDGQDWQPARLGVEVSAISTTQPAQTLLNELGLENSQLQIVVWQDATPVQTLSATVKAVQIQQGRFFLLAAGERLEFPDGSAVVAVTPDTISWSQPSTTLTLAELAQQPIWQEKLVPQLWQDLQTAELIPAPTATDDPLQVLGDWAIQLLELTGDQTPEAILTIEPATTDPPRTVIFSGSSLIYSDLHNPERFLVAIVEHTNNRRPILIVMNAGKLNLQKWSSQRQQFD
ncbi:hypothetical protein HJG54_02365 [Leptolyngbya sp. NK1-12]|uniref:Uncharacterized protein n=1 Tax=Leptolyngbya sp. NK1-12 TaxID=2547451 RepID=A0AA96WB58_9CYAN|nr:hypothetical protein [Leptolyngbya sp. NK1-12]WNZ21823.1 hypothetical protein HJG54_02365 [Leptolyngbya sp. NK1-12]